MAIQPSKVDRVVYIHTHTRLGVFSLRDNLP